MRYFYLPLLCFFTLWLPQYGSAQSNPAHLDSAITYVGIEELEGSNIGPQINRFLANVGLPPGNPYCAAFVSYNLNQAEQPTCKGTFTVEYPTRRTALAQDFITSESIEAKRVVRGLVVVPAGTIVVWKKGNTRFGHTGFTKDRWEGASGSTVEANTSPGATGNQRDGEGIWIRDRTIYPTNHFRITHFTNVDYGMEE